MSCEQALFSGKTNEDEWFVKTCLIIAYAYDLKWRTTDDILLQRKIFQFSNNNLAKKYVDSLCTIIKGLLNTGVEKSKIIWSQFK